LDTLKKVESGSYQQQAKIEHTDLTTDFIDRNACLRNKKGRLEWHPRQGSNLRPPD
jgi:hypothetical protein